MSANICKTRKKIVHPALWLNLHVLLPRSRIFHQYWCDTCRLEHDIGLSPIRRTPLDRHVSQHLQHTKTKKSCFWTGENRVPCRVTWCCLVKVSSWHPKNTASFVAAEDELRSFLTTRLYGSIMVNGGTSSRGTLVFEKHPLMIGTSNVWLAEVNSEVRVVIEKLVITERDYRAIV